MQNESIIYVQETGGIITPDKNLLHIIEGSPGSVDFPYETIWRLHQLQPGIVFCLSHVHPPGMTGLSGRDEMTVRTWAYALDPFPARIATITEINQVGDESLFQETIYLGILESKEVWIKRGKEGPRNFEIIMESKEIYHYNLIHPDQWYGKLLLDKSYK